MQQESTEKQALAEQSDEHTALQQDPGLQQNAGQQENNPQPQTSEQQTKQEQNLIDKFATYLCSVQAGSPAFELIKELFVTPAGIFIPENNLQSFVNIFQSWLKIESGAEGLLAEDRCLKLIFNNNQKSAFYILDGKNCKVGYLVHAGNINSLKSRLKIYAGTPIDGKKSLHPKDPFLNNLPKGVNISFGSAGQKVAISSDKIQITFDLADLPSIINIFKGSPRLRRYKSGLQSALREVIPEFCRLVLSSQPVDRNKLKILPSRFRKNNSFFCLRLSDTYLVFDNNKQFINCFGLKGKNLFDLISSEIRSLRNHLRSRRIDLIDLDMRNRHLAGALRLQNEKFFLPLGALLEWIQLCRNTNADNLKKNSQSASAPTLYDYMLELSKNFSSSAWVPERDIPNRYKNFANRSSRGKLHLNFRTSPNHLYAIDKRFEIVSIMRWVKPKTRQVQIKDGPIKVQP